jgi:iron only hydrogenase large subunit-like protein
MIAFVAPSAVANFADQYLRLNGWLASLGVAAIFDVTLGAELCAMSYAAHIRRTVPRLVIAQPCAAIVTYIQVHRPELLPYLAPLDSPMLHAMKMVRRSFPQLRDHKIVVTQTVNATGAST